mmetsp:Transcript_49551/g.117872  ORF Transcript_49551/g.117872 Transcript_49551/m.117872 type:complete len:1566 (+) Transcript_49551:63-4760(+)|eukprot:CAMPEP_0180131398 /NCGR_PEP_ID=MMETSP0986-20121125/8398_1 /TAXON_ID=697907 /ORGANISM="non described non described, Strain CCMP2293" /LENGTH=1565 /DNA_ID=CAMNT_0022071271 /DNA_START=63 /DNA_END=4760 /DNA_ORIENTATION=+
MGDGGQAIPFIALNAATGKFDVTPEAAVFLNSIDEPVAVIAVVGLYRTGKSFLMNRILLNQSGGFQVGPTVNPCTKGLWLWDKVCDGEDKDGNKKRYIIIDTEGIGALDTNTQHDSTIFSLALLLSSFFVYNSVGSIDEGALNNLSLVVNLTKHIHVRSSAQGGEDDGADFAQYFPSFLWLVRDFTLQLVTPDGQPFTSKEYLERALQPAPGFTEQIEAKNRIRRMLTHFFPERDCFTMVRPVTDESLLQKLSETPSEKLRPEFREQMTQLKANIMGAAHPKMMHGTGLDGSALVNLAYAYTQSINTGSVPSIQNAWSYICESKCQVALGLALKGYEVASKNLIDKVLPVSETELEDQHLEMDKAAWAIFAKNAIGTDTEEWKRQLEDKIRELYKNLKTENANRGRQRAQETLEKLYAPVDAKVAEEAFTTFEEFEAERKKVRQAYVDEVPSGPAKSEVLASFMEAKLSEAGLRFGARFQLEMQRETAKARAAVDEAVREMQAVKMEAEKTLGSVKLKLEYAEKYNEDAKTREKETKDEMGRMRSSHEESLKAVRDKAEEQLKTQVAALEDKRAKASADAQRFEQELMQFKKDQEKDMALVQQQMAFAQRSAEDAVTREADARKMLESAKRDAETEFKTLQDKFESERKDLSRKLQDMGEVGEKQSEQAKEWKGRHAALGVQLTTEIRQLQAELETRSRDYTAMEAQVVELEQVGGAKAKAENAQLTEAMEALRKQADTVGAERTLVQNALQISEEEKHRLDSSCVQLKKDVKAADDNVKRLSSEVETLTNELAENTDKHSSKESQVEALKNQLTKVTGEKQETQSKLAAQLEQAHNDLESLARKSAATIEELEAKHEEVAAKLADTEAESKKQQDDLEALATELEEAESRAKEGSSNSEQEWMTKLKDQEDKLRRKTAELNAAGEQAQADMRRGFSQEKEVLELRVKSLENQSQDVIEEKEAKEAELAETVKEFESAMDEMEVEHKHQMDKLTKETYDKYNAFEKKTTAEIAELTKHNEGLSSKNGVIDEQLRELKAQAKADKAEAEERYTRDMKETREEASRRIKELEAELTSLKAKYEMLQAESKKAEEVSSARYADLNNKFMSTQEKVDAEKKETARKSEERFKEMQTEIDELRNEGKRLENEKIMSNKDHETERALLKSHIAQLEKQLKDREAVLKELEESKETEVQEARSKLKDFCSTEEAKMERERDEQKKKYDDLKGKSDEKIRQLKDDLNARQTDIKVLTERIEGYKTSEARANASLSELKSRQSEERENISVQLKGIKDALSISQKELADERSEHQMTKLRSEKQEEWDRKELANLKEEIADKKKLMEAMISKDIYKRDMDSHKGQHQAAVQELLREREAEKIKLEAERQKVEEELVKLRAEVKKAQTEGVMTDSKQKEFAKLQETTERVSKELNDSKAEIDAMKKGLKKGDEELKGNKQLIETYTEKLRTAEVDREELRRERDDLDSKAMKLEFELKGVKQMESRKFEVEIMRLKTENEDLKRAEKKKQTIEPKPAGAGADSGGATTEVAAPALLSALERVRARRTTAQGGGAK